MRFSVLVASIIAGASSVSGQIELPGEQRICECRITASGSSPSVIFSGIPCAAVGGRECFSEIGNSISCVTSGAAWTDEQCREWGGNPVDNRVYRAVCRTYNGGGCPA